MEKIVHFYAHNDRKIYTEPSRGITCHFFVCECESFNCAVVVIVVVTIDATAIGCCMCLYRFYFPYRKKSFEACALIADRLHVRCGPFGVCNQCDSQVINIEQGIPCCLRYREHIGCVFSCAKIPAHVRTSSMNGDVSDANGVLLFIWKLLLGLTKSCVRFAYG